MANEGEKFEGYNQIDTVALSDVFILVDKSDTTMSPEGTTKWASGTQVGALFQSAANAAVENSYIDVPAMLADQANQNQGNIQYVEDASADASVNVGGAYYEYLGTTNLNLGDYRKLSEEEITVIESVPYYRKQVKDKDTNFGSYAGISNGMCYVEHDATYVTAVIIDNPLTSYYVEYATQWEAGKYVLKLANKTLSTTLIAKITELEAVDSGNKMRIKVAATIPQDRVDVNHTLEFAIDIDKEGGGNLQQTTENGAFTDVHTTFEGGLIVGDGSNGVIDIGSSLIEDDGGALNIDRDDGGIEVSCEVMNFNPTTSMNAPSLTNEMIDASSNQSLVTKAWVLLNALNSLQASIDGGNTATSEDTFSSLLIDLANGGSGSLVYQTMTDENGDDGAFFVVTNDTAGIGLIQSGGNIHDFGLEQDNGGWSLSEQSTDNGVGIHFDGSGGNFIVEISGINNSNDELGKFSVGKDVKPSLSFENTSNNHKTIFTLGAIAAENVKVILNTPSNSIDNEQYFVPLTFDGIKANADGEISTPFFKTQFDDIKYNPQDLLNADDDYKNNGVANVFRTIEDIVFNKIQVKMASDVNNTKTFIRVYKHSSHNSSVNIDDLTLLYTTTQIWDNDEDKLKTIKLPEHITLLTNEYLFVAASSKTVVDTKVKKWAADAGTERLIFTSSSDYGNIFNDTTWSRGGGSFTVAPPILSLVQSKFISDNQITIPNEIVAVVGTELNLYLDALVNTQDNGISTLSNIEIICDKGIIKDRMWQYTALVGDVGSETMTIKFYEDGEIIETKTVTLTTISNSAPSAVSDVLLIGDSITNNGTIPSTSRAKFIALGSNTPIYHGTQGSGFNLHEGRPGWKFSNFVGASSPFYNGGSLDIANYRSANSIANTFDVVSVQLGVNDSFKDNVCTLEELEAIIKDAKTLIDAFISDSASTKIIIQLPTIDGNTYGGWGANYEATKSKKVYKQNIFNLRSRILEEFDNGIYNGNVKVGIAGLVLDRYFGYPLGSSPSSARITTNVGSHTNALHPSPEGYQQLGDLVYTYILKEIQ